MKNQTKSKLETHDYSRFVHQFSDHHINFRFWIHQFCNSDDVLNDNFRFKKFTNISLFFFFCVVDRDLIELTWNLMTFSLKRILKKIFWASKMKTMTSIKEKMIWAFFNLIKNFFSFISFFQMSMIRDLFEVLFRINNETIFSTFFIFLIFLIILIFSLSKTKRERFFIFSESFFAFWIFFCETFVMTRFWTSFFFSS